jgi:hypothetical protein
MDHPLEGEPRLRRYWWIVVQPGQEEDVDVCRADPGHPVTLTVTASCAPWWTC